MKPRNDNKTYIRVRVNTRAKRETLTKVKPNTYTVDVKVRAERGLANERIRALLAKELGTDQKRLRLIKGATAPSKLFLLI